MKTSKRRVLFHSRVFLNPPGFESPSYVNGFIGESEHTSSGRPFAIFTIASCRHRIQFFLEPSPKPEVDAYIKMVQGLEKGLREKTNILSDSLILYYGASFIHIIYRENSVRLHDFIGDDGWTTEDKRELLVKHLSPFVKTVVENTQLFTKESGKKDDMPDCIL